MVFCKLWLIVPSVMISNGSPAANGIANRNEYEHNIKDNEQIFNEPCKTGTKWCSKPPG